MISAVDSNILLDLFADDPVHGLPSQRLLQQAYDEGALIVSEVVYAEVVPQFGSRQEFDAALKTLNVRLVSGGPDAAYLAGRKWGEYRKAGGTRSRVLSDFLIGGHASVHADRLVTRDRGFYRSYFSDLELLNG